MLFVTNRRIEGSRRSQPGRAIAFAQGDQEPGASLFFCQRLGPEQYVELTAVPFFSRLRRSRHRQLLFYVHGFSCQPEARVFPDALRLQALCDALDPDLAEVVADRLAVRRRFRPRPRLLGRPAVAPPPAAWRSPACSASSWPGATGWAPRRPASSTSTSSPTRWATACWRPRSPPGRTTTAPCRPCSATCSWSRPTSPTTCSRPAEPGIAAQRRCPQRRRLPRRRRLRPALEQGGQPQEPHGHAPPRPYRPGRPGTGARQCRRRRLRRLQQPLRPVRPLLPAGRPRRPARRRAAPPGRHDAHRQGREPRARPPPAHPGRHLHRPARARQQRPSARFTRNARVATAQG